MTSGQVDQGSVDQGSADQGSVDQGSADQGSVDQSSADRGGAGWVDEALREHTRHERLEAEAARGRRGHSHDVADREQQVLDRIDRARRRRPKIREERITMSHGSGGKATQTLIEAIFLDTFRNPLLEPLEDSAQLTIGGSRVALTTDSYVVSPLFFPGGDIGDLAVNGTVNDLSVAGATPLYLSAGFILEEGFPVADLTRVVASMRDAAVAAGVHVVTGDTKVVQRGKADGCYINTAGVGLIERDVTLGVAEARPGDAIIVSGPIGDHGITIMLARGELDIEADVRSDTAPLNGLVSGLLDAVPGTRALRDATRGGVATILNEIAKAADVGVLASEDDIPVRAEVRGASELLGIDPMYVACEGRLVAVVPGDEADRAVVALRADPLGEQAAVIGRVTAEQPGIVRLKTAFGGTRIVDLLVGDPLPRIC
jgi:hydrogenase expression/formation protein HypE